MCSVGVIQSYCPAMCQSRACTCPNRIDQCLNGGTFDPNSCTCRCPRGFFGTVCELLRLNQPCINQTCLNSGQFDQETCKCRCFNNYLGDRCEVVNCDVPDNNYCINFFANDCPLVPIIRSFCPHKCGQCPRTG